MKIKEQYQQGKRTAWIHCASLGEFEQSRPIIEEFKSKRPEFKIVLTFFSPSGYEIRKNYDKADYIWYLPIDFKRNATKFIDIVKPDLAVFVKYDLWYHYINTCEHRNIPVYVISANFRTGQVFFKWYGGWFRKILKMCRHIFVQNISSKELLNSIGVENITVAGDVRFDRVYATAKQAKEIPMLAAFKQSNKTFICGSSWEKDENVIIPYINTMPENFGLNFIIAPHVVKPDNIARIVKQISKNVIKYSEATFENIKGKEVLIIDNIGMLASAYKYGDYAYVGGGFSKNLHNVLEASAFGLPVIIGPEHDKFPEVAEMIEIGAVYSVNNPDEFKMTLDKLILDIELYKKASYEAGNFVSSRIGTTRTIFDSVV